MTTIFNIYVDNFALQALQIYINFLRTRSPHCEISEGTDCREFQTKINKAGTGHATTPINYSKRLSIFPHCWGEMDTSYFSYVEK